MLQCTKIGVAFKVCSTALWTDPYSAFFNRFSYRVVDINSISCRGSPPLPVTEASRPPQMSYPTSVHSQDVRKVQPMFWGESTVRDEVCLVCSYSDRSCLYPPATILSLVRSNLPFGSDLRVRNIRDGIAFMATWSDARYSQAFFWMQACNSSMVAMSDISVPYDFLQPWWMVWLLFGCPLDCGGRIILDWKHYELWLPRELERRCDLAAGLLQ